MSQKSSLIVDFEFGSHNLKVYHGISLIVQNQVDVLKYGHLEQSLSQKTYSLVSVHNFMNYVN